MWARGCGIAKAIISFRHLFYSKRGMPLSREVRCGIRWKIYNTPMPNTRQKWFNSILFFCLEALFF